MPSIVCPNCQFKVRIPAPEPTCPNCRELLPTAAPFPSKATLPDPNENLISTVFSGKTEPAIPEDTRAVALVEDNASFGAIPVSGQLYKQVEVPPPSIGQSQKHLVRTLPARLRMIPPTVEGLVEIPPNKDSVVLHPDWSLILLKIIFSPIWALAGSGHDHSQEYHQRPQLTVHSLRLKDERGDIHEVRMEGDLIRGGFSLNDWLSLWGEYRQGTLLVSRGYNHNTGSEIKFKPPVFAPVWLTRLTLACVPLLLLILYFVATMLIQQVHTLHLLK